MRMLLNYEFYVKIKIIAGDPNQNQIRVDKYQICVCHRWAKLLICVHGIDNKPTDMKHECNSW